MSSSGRRHWLPTSLSTVTLRRGLPSIRSIVQSRFKRSYRLLSALAVTRPEAYAARCESLVIESNLWTACSVIKSVASTAIIGPLFSRLISLLAARHERLARMLEKSIREDLRQRLIARAMKSVGSFEARVLFALLMNAPDRETILPLVKSVFPGCIARGNDSRHHQ